MYTYCTTNASNVKESLRKQEMVELLSVYGNQTNNPVVKSKRWLLNVCILYNECMEWEVKFEKARDRLNFSPSVGIEPTTTRLKATRSTG